MDGLSIEVRPQEGWQAGKYRFVIEHDGKTTICKGRIPLRPSEQSEGVVCNRRAVVTDDWGPIEIMIFSHPAVVDIDIIRDGRRLTRVHHDVEYEESWPNGTHCGISRTAAIVLKPPAAR